MKAQTDTSFPRKLILTSALLYKPGDALKRAGVDDGWVTSVAIPPDVSGQLTRSGDARAMRVYSYGGAAGPLTVCVTLQVGRIQLRSLACGAEESVREWLAWLRAARRARWLLVSQEPGQSQTFSHAMDADAMPVGEQSFVVLGAEDRDRKPSLENVGRVAVELGRPLSTLVGTLLPGWPVETLVVSAAGSLLRTELFEGTLLQFTR